LTKITRTGEESIAVLVAMLTTVKPNLTTKTQRHKDTKTQRSCKH